LVFEKWCFFGGVGMGRTCNGGGEHESEKKTNVKKTCES